MITNEPHSAEPIYLDNAATTPLLPEVAQAMLEVGLALPGNPSSQHGPGRDARRCLEEAREEIGYLLGAKSSGMDADRVIFTSGGTEAANLAIFGLNRSDEVAGAKSLVISSLEHPCVSAPAGQLESQGVTVNRLPATIEGTTDLEPLAELSVGLHRLVSLMLVNNETGIRQPVEQAAELCQAAGVPFYTDATQAVSKCPVHFRDLGVAALSCAAHKFHGPTGIGALVVRHGASLTPRLHGGYQQAGLRPGTESVPLAVGMATALRIAVEDLEENNRRLRTLQKRFEQALMTGLIPGEAHRQGIMIQTVGDLDRRVPHISNLIFPQVDRQALMIALDLAGIALSTGSACASGSSELSPTLLAMGLSEELISSSLRFSFSALTTSEEVDEAARRILNAVSDLR